MNTKPLIKNLLWNKCFNFFKLLIKANSGQFNKKKNSGVITSKEIFQMEF
jgi:hypothetical protein